MSEDNTNVSEELSIEEAVAGIADMLDDNLMAQDGARQEVADHAAKQSDEPKVSESEDEESDEDDLLADLDDEDGEDDDTPEEEDSDDTEEDSQEGDDTEVVIKVDGEDVTVTMDELKKGYSRQSDYTKKTQELAEQRKALEEEAKVLDYLKVQRDLQPEAISLQEDLRKIEEAKDALVKGYFVDDKGEMVQLTKEQYLATKENVENAEREAQWKAAQLQEKAGKVTPPKLDVLQEKVPEMFGKDEAARQQTLDNFAAVMTDVGFSKHEVDAVNDPRLILLLKEVVDGRALAEKVSKAKARKSGKAGVVSKSTRPTSKKSGKASKQAQKSADSSEAWKRVQDGDMESIGDAFMDFL